MGNLTLIRPAPPYKALGVALDLLHLKDPFSGWDSRQLVSTVKGAILRNHYILLKQEDRYTGFACWGRCSEEVGEGYINGTLHPTYRDCESGEHFLLFIIQAETSGQLKEMIRFMKQHHPDCKVYGRRFRKHQSKLAPVTLLHKH